MNSSSSSMLVFRSWILCAAWFSCLFSSASCRHGRDHGGNPDPIIFNELCALKDESGPCKALKQRYFFDVNSGGCELFEYGGCQGNANNFETLEECEEACVVSKDKNPCHLPQAVGPCRGLVKRFFFDTATQQCKQFYYGGCFGNANNFRSMTECQRRCENPDAPTVSTETPVITVRKPIMVQPDIVKEVRILSEPQVQLNVSAEPQNEVRILNEPEVQLNVSTQPQNDFSTSDICFSPIDTGTCSLALKRYAYNPETKRCQMFVYSGCGGNHNNFHSRKHCYHKCIRGKKGRRSWMIPIRKKNINRVLNRSIRTLSPVELQ
ncbi:PREDICTED: tissue factor pathway inhibitor-like [Cyprinodon variegatus]|uniref:Tissue factor pathway inhibitor-like n=1 Tax=Cyprinodon variegatus TaxID=28743 RepID=A0A3Q2EJX6_CYPVA|nr:PREDICTED: tissue factor pathway inhibitor-like [Cyprinodon variegatus]